VALDGGAVRLRPVAALRPAGERIHPLGVALLLIGLMTWFSPWSIACTTAAKRPGENARARAGERLSGRTRAAHTSEQEK